MDDALLVMPQKHRKEGRVYSGSRFEDTSHRGREIGVPRARHPASTVRKQRGGKARVRLRFSFFTQPRTSAPGVVLAHIQGVSSSPVQPFWKYSLDLYQEVSLHGDSRSHQAVDVE